MEAEVAPRLPVPGSVFERAVRPDGVLRPPPGFDKDLSPDQGAEDLAI